VVEASPAFEVSDNLIPLCLFFHPHLPLNQDQFIRGREARFNLGADEAGRRAEINRSLSNEATAPFSSGRQGQIPTDDLRSQRRDEGGAQTTFIESGDPVTVTRSRPASVEIRGPDGSVEEVLEGGNGRTNTVPAGSDTAANAQPSTRLGRFASEALSSIEGLEAEGFAADDDRREFNQGMDRAIRQAKTKEELDELRGIAVKSGIGGDAFDRRTQWWERRR